MAERAQIDVIIEGAQAATTLGQLEDSAEALNEALRGAEIGSAEYKQLNDQLVETNRQVKNLELGFEALDNEQVASEIGSVAGAIGDVTSSLILLGGENESLEKMAANIQTALGVSMAFKGAIEGISSAQKLWTNIVKRYTVVQTVANGVTKAFNTLLRMNPIGLVVTAVAALIGALVALGSQIEAVGNWFRTVGEWFVTTFSGILEFFGLVDRATIDQINRERELAAEKKRQHEENTKQHKQRLNEIEERRNAEREAFEAQQTEFDLEIERMEAEGKNAQALRITKQEAVMKEIEDQIKAIREIEASWAAYYERQAELQGKSREEYIEILKGQGIDVLALQEELNGEIEKLDQQLFSAESGLLKLEREQREANAKKAEELAKNELARIHELQKQKLAALDEIEQAENEYLDSQLSRIDREINAVEDKYFRLIEEAKKYDQDTTILEQAREDAIAKIRIEEENRVSKIIQDNRLTSFENELKEKEILSRDDIQKRLEIQLEGFELERDLALQQEDLTEAEIFAIEEKYRQQTIQATKDAAEAEAQARIEAIDKWEERAMTVLGAVEDIQTIFHGKELKRIKEKRDRGEALTKNEIKRLKREDQIRKAQALTQIVADTARGISGAVAAGAGVPFPGNLFAIGSGIASVLSGIAQASQVLGESPDLGGSGGGLGGDTGGGGIDGGGTDAVPDLDPLGFGSTLLNQPQKVFVTETDITATQGKVSVIEEQASFG